MISCEVLHVGSAGIRPASYCGTSLATHRSKLNSESHHYAEAAGEGGGEVCWKLTRISGQLAGYEGGWQSLWGVSYACLCKQVCAGCWMWRPSRHTNLSCRAAQYEGAAAWILKVTFVLAAFLIHRGGKAEDLRLSLGGSYFNFKTCSCLRTACFCFVLFLFFFWWKFY